MPSLTVIGNPFGSSIGASEVDADVATQAELDATTSIYRLLLRAGTTLTNAAASGTTYVLSAATSNSTAVNAANVGNSHDWWRHLAAADYTLSGKTTKLRVRATVATVAVAPAVTITVGLYPLTVAAGTVTPGTVVSGSTAAVATPGTNAYTTVDSGDFNIPADGPYGLCVIVDGTPSASLGIGAELQLRHV